MKYLRLGTIYSLFTIAVFFIGVVEVWEHLHGDMESWIRGVWGAGGAFLLYLDYLIAMDRIEQEGTDESK